jgi:hypothetical protein
MRDRHLLGPFSPWIVVVVLVAVALCALAFLGVLDRERRNTDLYDIEKYKVIPPEKIGYREVAIYATGMEAVTSIAVGPDGKIAVGGDSGVRVLDADGKGLRSMLLSEKPRALAFAPDGELYVGLGRTVLRGMDRGAPSPPISLSGENAQITSLAVVEKAVYVADAGARIVWKLSRSGRLLRRIGEKNLDRDVLCFNVPSPYFDVFAARDGLLRIVDPGRHLIAAYTPEGAPELTWGTATFELEGFSGCCNPSHMTMFPDGRYVTSEKGIPRVKVYDPKGVFITAVVGPEGLSTEYDPCDVAVDRDGRILVLDPGACIVRVFEPLPESPRED